MVFEKRYENGLRLVVKKMEGLKSVTMGVIVGTGSAVETDEEDGISHFIEHMMFKGTHKRNAFEISDAFDRIGAQVNAFTGKDVTCYYAKCTSDHTAETFEILSDLFLNSVFPEEEMTREKGVVCEEIAMNEDTPEDLCLDQLARAFYGSKNYGRNILGPCSNVKGFTVQDIQKYLSARYCPENIVLSFAGDLEFDDALSLVEKYFGNLPKGNFQKRTKKICLQGQSLLTRKKVEQMHIGIGYSAPSRDHELADVARAVNVVLGGNMSSRLFQEVREKQGLAYSVYSYISAFEECGSLIVYAGVNSENVLKAYEAINRVVDELKEKGITEGEFLRSREQMKAGMFFANESTSSQMILYGKYMLQRDKLFDFDEELNKLNAMTLDQAQAVLKLLFNAEGKAVSLIGNTKKKLLLS